MTQPGPSQTGQSTIEPNPSRPEVNAEPEVEARLALLRARYGAAFAGDEAGVARTAIEGAVARDAQLRRVRLGNGDEPVGAFAPFRRPIEEGGS